MRNERSFVMEAIINFFKEFAALVPTIRIMDIVDILVVAFVIYKIILMLQTTSSARIAKSIVIILLLTALTSVLHMYLMNYLLDKILEIGLLALVIMFQPELRRILEKLGSKSFREILSTKQEMRNIDYVISETVKACEIMSRERTGVLIVFERTSSLEDYQKTGIVIDARVFHHRHQLFQIQLASPLPPEFLHEFFLPSGAGQYGPDKSNYMHLQSQ